MTNFAAFRCFHCHQLLAITSHGICCRCVKLLNIKPYCGHCGAILNEESLACGACLNSSAKWHKLVKITQYASPLSTWIHHFKFHQAYWYDIPLARLLLLAVKQAQRAHYLTLPEIIMPVPLHPKRQWQRGYNQAELLARPLSRWLNIPIDCHSLQRLRHTTPQHELSGKARLSNLHNAFCYMSEKQYKRIALVDDVITTGSTLNEICMLLRKQGVEEIQVWCLAKT